MRCRHFGDCGGCSLPGVPYGEQLAEKRDRLAATLRTPVAPMVASPGQTRFRHKVAFVFGGARGRGIVMGHYAAGSRRIVPIRECPVQSDRGNRIAFALRDALVRWRVAPGLLRHVLVRTTSDEKEALAMLVVRRNDRSLRAPVRAFLDSRDAPDGFFVNLHDRPNPFLLGKTTIHIAGRRFILERGLGPSFRISPTAFFQPNVRAAKHLLDLVLAGVGSASSVLDLYCGGGLFALPLAQRGARVVAVEENPEGIEDLRANLEANRLPAGRVRPVKARVEDFLRREPQDGVEAVVLDPPRSGCASGVIDGVFAIPSLRRVVYVSCNPEALAEDMPRIRERGWRPETIVPVDMFPHTDHVETVVTWVPEPRGRASSRGEGRRRDPKRRLDSGHG